VHPTDTTALTRRGLRLAQTTIAWNVVEGAVAITAGLAAGLISVIGFGLDSGIESVSAVLVALRLSARLRHGDADEARERRALRGVALTFFALAAWITAAGIRTLALGEQPESSPLAVVLLTVSLIVMPLLARAKTTVGRALADPLILADAAETRMCAWLSGSTLIALVGFRLTGAAWLDVAGGLVIAVFAVREGLEAWAGELVEDDDDD